jgi:hypothetical protein
MRPQPRLWRCLTQEWVPIDQRVAWSWWYALCQAKWSIAVAWREDLLAVNRRPARLSGEEVEAYFQQVATPAVLMQLVSSLWHERVLTTRDRQQIEAQILDQVDARGAWVHGKRRSVYG